MSRKSATSARNREKGHAFEREFAQSLREAFPHRAETIERTIQTRGAAKEGSDVRFPNLWPECQDSQDPTPLVKLAQAERDMRAAGRRCVPIAVTHKKRARVSYVHLRSKAWVWLCYAGLLGDAGLEELMLRESVDAVVCVELPDFIRVIKAARLDERLSVPSF